MAAKKGITVTIDPDEIMHTGISKSKEGYNHASISAKRGDGEYVSINYEWKGDGIPDFAMDMMAFMQANKEEIASAIAKNNPEVEVDAVEEDAVEEEAAPKCPAGKRF